MRRRREPIPFRVRLRRWLVGFVRGATTALLVLASLSLATRLYLQRAWEPENAADELAARPSALSSLQTIEHLQRIEAALDVYRLKHDQYPESLDALVEEGLLGQRSLRFPDYDTPYFYRALGRSYLLYPPTR